MLMMCMTICLASCSGVKGNDEALSETQNVEFNEANKKLPNIVILATGGTIAGTGDDTVQYKPGQLDVDSLIKSVPGIEKIANLQGIQVCNINSDDITADKWITLTNTINELALRDDVDGFVITHGTDTMDETSYFLNLTVKTDKPVVITGSMRPATVVSADGPMNLYESVALAGSKDAVGKGVLVCFSGRILSGRDVQKNNTHLTDAFEADDYGCLGYMVDETPYFYMNSSRKHTKDTEFDVSKLSDLPKVDVVYFSVDADADILSYCVNKGAKGIVVAGAGAGEYSQAWNDKIQALESKKIPVVRSSRIGSGMVCDSANYGGYTIGAGDLAPQKAAVLLRLALTKTNDIKEVSRIFGTY